MKQVFEFVSRCLLNHSVVEASLDKSVLKSFVLPLIIVIAMNC